MKSNLITHADVHRVCSMIGHESGRVYVDEEALEQKPIPPADVRAVRDAEIVKRHADGDSQKKLAFDFKLDASSISRILRERRG